ncbi:MAG: MerR family transcriptional regulator [Bacteroidota bacterium]
MSNTEIPGIIDKDADKIYYSIGEVAARFGVNTSLIRFWEKEFDIIKPHKNKKGNRMFTPDDVNNFHIIFHLVKERGYTLQGAKEKLKGNKVEVAGSMEIVKSLQKIKDFLNEIKSEL